MKFANCIFTYLYTKYHIDIYFCLKSIYMCDILDIEKGKAREAAHPQQFVTVVLQPSLLQVMAAIFVFP